MLPFNVELKSGAAVQHQVVFATKRALAVGALRAGDEFPSIRTLSTSLKINPNTAQKVIAKLTEEGILEVRPGIGTVVASLKRCSKATKREMQARFEHLVVEAWCKGIELNEIVSSIDNCWDQLVQPTSPQKLKSGQEIESDS